MKRVFLFTADLSRVATVEIPPFPEGHLPAVILWGDRCFVHQPASECSNPRCSCQLSYVETFMVVSVTPSPGL